MSLPRGLDRGPLPDRIPTLEPKIFFPQPMVGDGLTHPSGFISCLMLRDTFVHLSGIVGAVLFDIVQSID